MLFDPTVSDATFIEGRPPKDIKETIESIREQLGLDGESPWSLISARTKLGRVLFEIEEETSLGPRRMIGKLGRSDRAKALNQTLTCLRDAGFQSPARMTVPEPIACLPDIGLVLQEKAPGRPASELLLQSSGRAAFAAADCARWLAALHQCDVEAPPCAIDTQVIPQWTRELADEIPGESERLDKIANAIGVALDDSPKDAVPCHGDFHPMNILIKGTQRVTGLDIDKFGAREPEADIGWFLMQTAAFGFFETRRFQTTEGARRAFIECYEAEMGDPIRTNRAAVYIAMAFLKNLHFELVLLKTGHTEYAGPWLKAAGSAILQGDLYFSENT